MIIDPATAAGKLDYLGQTYYFCNPGCLKKFQANPAAYLKPKTTTPQLVTIGGTYSIPYSPLPTPHSSYTCPMHPEIVRNGPGTCPICGMALEPQIITADELPNVELVDMSRRFWLSLAFTIPIFIVAMTEMLPGNPLELWKTPTSLRWFQFILTTLVMFFGWPIFQRGWPSIVNRSLNMFTLIAVGTGVAYGYSVVATLWPSVFPESMRHHNGMVDVYFEAAAVIVTLVLLGQVLELRARKPPAQSARCSASRQKPPAVSRPTVANTMCRSTRCKSAIGCASAPARRCRSTASCSKATAPSTSR